MVTIVGSSIVDNAAVRAGGGVSVTGGTVNLTRSTLSGNTAPGAAGILNTGTTTVTNSTISGNTALTGSSGGIATQAGTLSLLASTVTDNTAATFGAGIVKLGGNIALEASRLVTLPIILLSYAVSTGLVYSQTVSAFAVGLVAWFFAYLGLRSGAKAVRRERLLGVASEA